MQIAFYLLSLAAPVFALAIPAPKGGGGGGGRGSFGGGSRGASPLPPVIPKTSQHLITSPIDHPPSAHHLFIKTDPPHLSQSGGSYHGYSWSGSSFAAGAFTGYLGGVYVGHGPFHGGADGQQRYREPPPDCVVAQTLSTGGAGPPAADCYYTWEHWHGDNFLMYVIRIAASGQDVKGWSNGVVDNIKGECGGNHMITSSSSEWYWHANEDYGEVRHVNGSTFHGLEMTVPLGTWNAGEDEKSCVTTAIKKASCGIELNFTNGGCYRKPGTSKAPWTIKEH